MKYIFIYSNNLLQVALRPGHDTKMTTVIISLPSLISVVNEHFSNTLLDTFLGFSVVKRKPRHLLFSTVFGIIRSRTQIKIFNFDIVYSSNPFLQ